MNYRTAKKGVEDFTWCRGECLQIRGSLVMFCNLVFQQRFQPLCLLQLFEETPLRLYTFPFGHPLKRPVYDTDHVDWGMPKMMPSKNARASSAFWSCFPFSCHLTEGDKNQSWGAKSGEDSGWVTSWTSLVARQSTVTAAVCALSLSWWSSRPRTPIQGRRLHHAWKILGKLVDIPVSRNRLSVLKWYVGNIVKFCKETQYHLFGSISVSL